MLQHTAVHEHVMRHALFFYALVVGLCLTAAVDVVFGGGSPAASRTGAAILAAALIWPHARGLYANLRLHGDPSFREPHYWTEGWREPTYFRQLAQRLPHEDAIILTNHNRLPLLRYWIRRPVYSATLLRYPFRRGRPLPGSRYQIELTVNHLRDLYAGELPRLWYLYFFRSSPDSHYNRDAVLWQLVDGTWNRPTVRDRFDNFRQLVQARGGSTSYPVVARGDGWLCFDASRLVDALPEEWTTKLPPTRAEFGPPR